MREEFTYEQGLEIAKSEFKEEGRREGKIESAIETCNDRGDNFSDTFEYISGKFNLSAEEANRYMDLYWQN